MNRGKWSTFWRRIRPLRNRRRYFLGSLRYPGENNPYHNRTLMPFKNVLLLLLCLPPVLHGQNPRPDQLLADPDITWVARLEMNWNLDRPGEAAFPFILTEEEREFSLTDRTELLKVDREALSPHFATTEQVLTHHLLDLVLKDQLPVYSVADGHKLSAEEVLSIWEKMDTVQVFDPETFESRQAVVRRGLDPGNIREYRAEIYLYYKASQARFFANLAFLTPIYDHESGAEPLFKIQGGGPGPAEFTSSTLNQRRFTWISQTWRELPLAQVEVVKQTGPDLNALLEHLARMEDDHLQPPRTYFQKLALSPEDRDRLLHPSRDTITTFDPETFAATTTVWDYPPMLANEPAFIETQFLWLFNQEIQHVSVYLKSVTPFTVQERNETSFRVPLFLLRY